MQLNEIYVNQDFQWREQKRSLNEENRNLERKVTVCKSSQGSETLSTYW